MSLEDCWKPPLAARPPSTRRGQHSRNFAALARSVAEVDDLLGPALGSRATILISLKPVPVPPLPSLPMNRIGWFTFKQETAVLP